MHRDPFGEITRDDSTKRQVTIALIHAQEEQKDVLQFS